MGLWEKMKDTTFYKSIYRNDYPDTPRHQVLVILNSVVLHLHPVRVPRRALRETFTWGLGGTSLLMFLLLTITGVWLMFYYVPAVPNAYFTMIEIESDVYFGAFARNLHRWTAHAMVLAVFLHMSRVFFTGSYKPPREFDWALGVVLFVVTLLLSFTGYLLPWDQLAIWAITVGGEMAASTPLIGREVAFLLLGGYEVGAPTLIRWYTLHVIFLPLICIALMSIHFWRVRKDGGISVPVDDDEAAGDQ